ncbi:ABC transporter substrate-binding protein [Streptomyces sp. NPDC094034]|uniref:heme/hemin ABC transporter substrate-binding protein n=1 Tax=Streptomyces sp. NPDC094034 TaxID=3155309 RepID=UPI00331E15D8
MRRSRLTGAFLSVIALALALTGCGSSGGGGGGTDTTDAKRNPTPAAAADRLEPLAAAPTPRLPVTVNSADGRKVTVASADRIVPLTGSLSEIVFTLGLGERVVARDITATFEQAAKLPVVTRAHDVSAEGVLSLGPTLVLADSTTGPAEAIGQIRDAGVPLVVVDPAKSLADVGTRIDAVAGALGVPAAGAELRKRTEERIDAVRDGIPTDEQGTRGSGRDGGKDSGKDSGKDGGKDSGKDGGKDAGKDGGKPRVAFLYLRGSASVYLLGGRESGASSLLEAAGAVDAGKESGLTGDFTAITSEALAKAAPDAILVMTKGLDSVGGVDGLVRIPGIAETPAGMDRRVIAIDDGVLLNYGPRTDEVLRSIVKQLYADGK